MHLSTPFTLTIGVLYYQSIQARPAFVAFPLLRGEAMVNVVAVIIKMLSPVLPTSLVQTPWPVILSLSPVRIGGGCPFAAWL